MVSFLLGPLEFPLVVATQEVIFFQLFGASILQNQIQQHVAGRIYSVLAVVADLDRVEFFTASQEVTERDPLAVDTKKGELKPSDFRLPLRQAHVKVRHNRIG